MADREIAVGLGLRNHAEILVIDRDIDAGLAELVDGTSHHLFLRDSLRRSQMAVHPHSRGKAVALVDIERDQHLHAGLDFPDPLPERKQYIALESHVEKRADFRDLPNLKLSDFADREQRATRRRNQAI